MPDAPVPLPRPDAEESQRFLGRLFVLAGLLLAGLAGFNVAIDPRADFDTGWLPPVAVRHRAKRVELLAGSLQPEPRLLVLGSSRVWKVEPEFLQDELRLPAFVAGVDDARSEDLLALARYALLERRLPVEVILLQLDVPMFHQDLAASAQLVREPALRKHLPANLPWSEFAAPYLDTLTHGLLLESVRTIQVLRTMNWRPVHDVQILARGNIRYRHREEKIRAGSFNLEGHIHATLGTFLEIYRGFEHLSPRRLGYLRELLALAESEGIEVFGYIAPVHPQYAEVLGRRTRYPRLLPALRREAARALNGPGRRFFDASDLDSFGGDPALYYDGIHPREENNRRLLRVLFADRLVGLAIQ